MIGYRRGLTVVVAVVAASAFAFAAPAAAAHEEEVRDAAKVLVQQAIALIVNTPDDRGGIDEHIHLALAAPDQEGVDADLLEQAEAAFEAGDLTRTEELLLACIGARPVTGDQPPKPIRETSEEPVEEEAGGHADEGPAPPGFAAGAETGTTVVLDAYRQPVHLAGEGGVLLALSVVALAAGALLTWRWRPHDSVRRLRRAGASGSEA
jgi:hypothetical protein